MDAYMFMLDSGWADRACFLQVIATNQCLGGMITRTEGSNRNQHFYSLLSITFLFHVTVFAANARAIRLTHVQFPGVCTTWHYSLPPFQHCNRARVVTKHSSHVFILGPNRTGDRPNDCIVAFINTCDPRRSLYNIPLHSTHRRKLQNPLPLHLARL